MPVDTEQTPSLLRLGDEGPWVLLLQRGMRDMGYHVLLDGIFTDELEGWIKRLQLERKLMVTGIVGPETWRVLPPLVD